MALEVQHSAGPYTKVILVRAVSDTVKVTSGVPQGSVL